MPRCHPPSQSSTLCQRQTSGSRDAEGQDGRDTSELLACVWAERKADATAQVPLLAVRRGRVGPSGEEKQASLTSWPMLRGCVCVVLGEVTSVTPLREACSVGCACPHVRSRETCAPVHRTCTSVCAAAHVHVLPYMYSTCG